MSRRDMPGSSLRDLARFRYARRRRCSSYDRSGGNADYTDIRPGDTAVLANITGAGIITHIWITARCFEEHYLRKVILKMYWDGEAAPSVLVPLGDFFGVGHGVTKNFNSAPLQMSPEDGRALNCWFPMPFSTGALIEVTSECSDQDCRLYVYVDYEEHESLDPELARFHACWRRENPTNGIDHHAVGRSHHDWMYEGKNEDFSGNYLILEAEGKGHYVGCSLNIHNLNPTLNWNWYGEGDDMIFIDGEEFPSLYGTGTEDYFNTSWCPRQEFQSPYHGIIKGGGDNWFGHITMYRFHVEDPVMFENSIKVTIEHGHANHRSDDYASTAYWYQNEPHKPFGLLPVSQRMPRPERPRS